MINAPADYDYIDWVNGDMPTNLINGEIMPLRAAARKGDLRGVDIAFLAEYVREALHAFNGAVYTYASGSGAWTWRAFSEAGSHNPITLTKQLSGYQIQSIIWDLLSSDLALGGPYQENRRLYGFYTGATTVEKRFWTATENNRSFADLALQIEGMATHGLIDSPSVARGNFGTGHKLDRADLEALFADCKKLAYPVTWASPYTSVGGFNACFSRDEMTYESEGTRGPDPYWSPSYAFRVTGDWYSGDNNYTLLWEHPNVTRDIMTIPMTRLGSVHVYALYEHEYLSYSGGSSRLVYDYGIMDLESWLTKTVANNVTHYGVTPNLMRSLAHTMMTGAAPTSSARTYEIARMTPIVIGTLGSRLKWW